MSDEITVELAVTNTVLVEVSTGATGAPGATGATGPAGADGVSPDLLAIAAQGWDVSHLGTVGATLAMDVAAYSEFTATLPLTGTATTISFSGMPATPTAWPVLHLITGATFDAVTWSGIDGTGVTLAASTAHTIGFQPVKTTSAWKVVAILMHSESDA